MIIDVQLIDTHDLSILNIKKRSCEMKRADLRFDGNENLPVLNSVA